MISNSIYLLTESRTRLFITLITILFLSFGLRMIWISYNQLQIAHTQLAEHKEKLAIISYERAIHPFFPFSPYRQQAIEQMQRLNHSLEQSSRKNLALEGWRRLRGAILSSRHLFGQPDKDLLLVSNANIARLASLTDTQTRMRKEFIQVEASGLLANHPKDINRIWGVLQFLLLLSWIFTTSRTIWLWQMIEFRTKVKWVAISVGSWLGWLISLYMAG